MGCGGERTSEGPWARRAYERRWRSAKVQSRRQICWLVGDETGQVPGMLIVLIGGSIVFEIQINGEKRACSACVSMSM